MSNIKKITSVFATLFCVGQGAMVNASTKETSTDPVSSTNELITLNKTNDEYLDGKADFGVDQSKTKKIDEENNSNNEESEVSSLSKEATETDEAGLVKMEKDTAAVNRGAKTIIRKNYSLNKRIENPGRTFLFNFRGPIRPTDNLLEGEKIYYPNVPDFDGLINCGISEEQAKSFYNEIQKCINLRNETWKKQYGDNSAWLKEKDILKDELAVLSEVVRQQAVDYYKTSINRDGNINKLRNYSHALGNGIDKLIEALENSDWSNEDKKEIDNTIKEYKENPRIKLLWYNETDACPLRNVIIKLGEAKIIHLYTKLFLKVIDEIENTDNLLNDDLYRNPADGETEKDIDTIKNKIMDFILDKDSTISAQLDADLSRLFMTSDGFFDKFNDYENYKKETNLNKSNKPIIGRVN